VTLSRFLLMRARTADPAECAALSAAVIVA
jgi:hypothetical protein